MSFGTRASLPPGAGLTIANAQLAVDGDQVGHPEIKGNVKTADTRNFWPSVETFPMIQGCDYTQDAEAFLFMGEAMGRKMLDLLK